MGAADIDRLEIEVEAQAKGANQQLDALISKLEKVSSVLGGASGKGLNSFASGISKISGHTAAIEKMASSMEKLKDGLSFDSQKLTNIASGIRTLSNSATGFKGGKSAEITSLARALRKFSEVDTNSMYGVTSALQNLSNGLAGAQNINVAGVTSIAAALSKLGGKNATTGTGNLIKIKDDLASFVAGMNNIGAMTFDVTGLAQLIPTLSKLGGKASTQATKNLPTLSAQLQSFVRQMNQIGELKFNMSGMNEMASAISRLGGVAAGRAITNLPLLAKNLSELMETLSKAPAVSNNIIEMTNALAKLASQGSKVGSTLSTMGNKGSKSTSILSGLFSSDGKAGKSLKSFSQIAGAFYANFFMVIRGFKGLWNTVNSSMDFLETVNYFEVAMRKLGDDAAANWQQAGYDSAEAYASSFSSRAKQLTAKMTGFDIDTDGNATYTGQKNLGMNPDTVMNYQAMFAQVSESIGVAEESALNFSTALTMLGTDWASLRNTTFEQAFEKFASALAGQSRAVRAFGIDITNATLQEYAYKYGLTGAISEMNQATKAQLRLLAILDQSKVAYGDLANTMESPANQLRMLRQNFSNLARTIGNLFLPIIEKVLPYINGLVMAMQRLFAWVGGLLGINLSGINSSIGGASNGIEDLVGGADDAEDALNGANDAAKKLKNTVLGFDELNQLNDPTSGSSSGSGSGGSGGGSAILDEEIQKALEEYQKAWDDAFDRMENKAQKIADKICAAFKRGDYEGIGKYISDGITKGLNSIKWESVYSVAKDFGKGFAEFLNGLITPELFGAVGSTIAGALNTAMYTALSFGEEFSFSNLGTSIATGINKIFEDFDFEALAETLNTWVDGIEEAIVSALSTLSWSTIAEKAGDFFGNLDFDTFLVLFGLTKVGKNTFKSIGKAFLGWINKGLASVLGVEAGKGIWDTLKIALATTLESYGGWAGLFTMDFATIAGAGTWTEIGLAVATGIFSAIAAAIAGWNIGELIGRAIFGDEAYDDFSWFGDNGFFDSLDYFFTVMIPEKFMEWVKDVKEYFLGLDWFSTISDAITGALDSITDKLFKFDWAESWFDEAGEAFKTAFDGKRDGFMDIGGWILEGILDGIVGVLAGIGDFVASIFTSLWDALCEVFGIHSPSKEMKPIGEYILLGIIEGFQDAFSNIIDAVSGFFTSIWDGLCNVFGIHSPAKNMNSIGENILLGIKEGFENTIGNLTDALSALKDKVIGMFDGIKEKFQSIGSYITDGLADGIRSGFSGAATAATGLANNVMNTVKDKLGIHSPSKVMDEIGVFTGTGFANGILKTVGQVQQSVNMMVEPVKMEPVSAARFTVEAEQRMINTGIANAHNTQPVITEISDNIKSLITDAVAEVMVSMMNGEAISLKADVTVENELKCDSETMYKIVQKGKEKHDRRYHIVNEF